MGRTFIMRLLPKKFLAHGTVTTTRTKLRRPAPLHFRPLLECLEGRDLPSTVTWINPTSGDWDKASNWSTHSIPTAADDVVINTLGITVAHSASNNDAVHSLTSQAAIQISNGQLYIGSASTLAHALVLTGGTITGPGNITISGRFVWTGGT